MLHWFVFFCIIINHIPIFNRLLPKMHVRKAFLENAGMKMWINAYN